MKPAPMFLFACVVAAVSGAVGGAAIDTTPIQRAGVGAPGFMLDPAPFDSSAELLAEPALPDHYDMLTPSGRVEVAELGTYGLRSQRRFGWPEPAPLPPLEPLPESAPVVEEWPRAEAAVTESPPASQDPAPSAETGGARTIQVAAALSAG